MKKIIIGLATLLSIGTAQAYTLFSNVQMDMVIQPGCTFTAKNFSADFGSVMAGKTGKTQATIGLICSTGVNYGIGLSSTSPYSSTGEIPATGTTDDLRVIGYADAGYSQNLAFTRINGVGDGTAQSKTLFFKVINKSDSQQRILKSGIFNATYTVEIYF